MEDAAGPDDGRGFDGFLEDLSRREALGILALAGTIGVSVTQSRSSEQLDEAENRFAELATVINEADLVAPPASERLATRVSEALETAEEAFAQPAEDDPETEQRRAALREAKGYYTGLARTLEIANSLREAIVGSELLVLYDDGSVEFEPANHFDTTELGGAITELVNAEKDPNDATTRDRTLLPDQQHVVDSLRRQRDILDRHIAAQQAYLDSATAIEAGIRAHEQSNFDATRTALTNAREALTNGISETNHRFRLRDGSLSLGQYATLLARRRKAVTKVLNVADASVPAEERQSAADQAIDFLFEARQVLIN